MAGLVHPKRVTHYRAWRSAFADPPFNARRQKNGSYDNDVECVVEKLSVRKRLGCLGECRAVVERRIGWDAQFRPTASGYARARGWTSFLSELPEMNATQLWSTAPTSCCSSMHFFANSPSYPHRRQEASEGKSPLGSRTPHRRSPAQAAPPLRQERRRTLQMKTPQGPQSFLLRCLSHLSWPT